jgi:hypothetical protein
MMQIETIKIIAVHSGKKEREKQNRRKKSTPVQLA